MAIKPTKLEQINESQDKSIFTEKKINRIHTEKNIRPGFEPRTLGYKDDGINSIPSAQEPGNC